MLAMTQQGASVHFRVNWIEETLGNIAQGELLTIYYDLRRLFNVSVTPHYASLGWINATVRFYPSCQTYVGTQMGQIASIATGDLFLVPFEIQVPLDTTQIEVWFHRTTSAGHIEWDTRFGQNYWFSVARRGPHHPVTCRVGAQRNLSVISVFNSAVMQPDRWSQAHSRQVDLSDRNHDPHLYLKVWVCNLTSNKQVWSDIHLFDVYNRLIASATVALQFLQPAGNGGEFFALTTNLSKLPNVALSRLSSRLCQVQYRLYCQTNGQLFTDGILHQHPLPTSPPYM